MNKQKVWVEKMPNSCVSCKYFDEHRRQCNLEICLQWSEDKFKFNDCPLHSIKDFKRELVNENHQKIIKFIEELAWKDVQYDAYQSRYGRKGGGR